MALVWAVALLVLALVVVPLLPPLLEAYGRYLDWVWDSFGLR